MMPSEKFRKFLESQAKRMPLKINKSKVSWEERGERAASSQPSDFLESVYFGKELRDTVVMERGVAAMLQHRLTELEKENENLRKSTKILKITLGAVAVVAAILIVWTILQLVPVWIQWFAYSYLLPASLLHSTFLNKYEYRESALTQASSSDKTVKNLLLELNRIKGIKIGAAK